MSDDRLIRFEEDNYDTLMEKFIKLYQDKWDELVYDEYTDSMWEPDDMEDR